MKLLVSILSCLVLFSCAKEEKINYVSSGFSYHYKVKLAHDTITEYSRYDNGQLQYVVKYEFSDSLCTIRQFTASGLLKGYTEAWVGSSGFVENSTETWYSDSGIFQNYDTLKYEYNDGFLSTKTSDHYKVKYTFTMSGENTAETKVSGGSWSCRDSYTYNALSVNIDVINFKNHLFGKPNKNLPLTGVYSQGCPCGSSSSVPSGRFEYKLDDIGRLIQKDQFYIPCHHQGDYVNGTITTYTYEYY